MRSNLTYLYTVANATAALTIGIYYLIGQDNLFFNLCGICWYLLMYGNMALCLKGSVHRLPRQALLILPVIIMLLAGNASYALALGQWTSHVPPLLAIAYYLTACYYSHRLYIERSEPFARRPHPITTVLYGIYYLAVMALAIFNLTYLVIASILKMSSPIANMQLLYNALPLWVAAVSIGWWIRLRPSLVRKAIPAIALLTIFGFIIPVLALPNAQKNANDAYQRTYGGSDVSVGFSIPKMLFGYSERGYQVERDIAYHTFTYNEESYPLKYDMYKPSEAKPSLPVIIRLHGSGGQKGFMNNISESALLASRGYAVFDLNYGNEACKPSNEILAANVCAFLAYLGDHAEELGVDKDRVIVSGGSRGGKMTLMTAVRWANNALYDIRHKVTLKGIVLQYAVMTDVFSRTGEERIVALEELNENLPPVLAINVTNDGSVQGGHLMQGVLLTHGVDMCNIELRFGVHGADSRTYSGWGQMNTAYFLRFADDRCRN